MEYTTNDALNILFRCSIQTAPTLMKHLMRGGFEISESTLKKKFAILKDGKVLEDGRKSNKRPPYLTEEKLKKIKEAHQAAPEGSSLQIARKAKLKRNPRTVNRGLQKLGLKYMRIEKVPFLTEDHKLKRIAFAQAHLTDRLWRRTFFLDESTFQAFPVKKYCYQDPKNRITKPQPKHPPKINAITMISYFGPTRIILFEENLEAGLFVDFLKILVKDANKLYPEGSFRIYFDNDSKHTAHVVQRHIVENKLNVPNDWPSSSPDLNPIENTWGRLGTEIQKFTPKTLDDLKKRLRSLWKRFITQDYCKKLIESMHNRMQQVIERKGLKVDY